MQPTLPIAVIGYTLHIITTAHRTHIARLVRPDGRVADEWTTTCFNWQLKGKIAALRESIEASLGDKATLPTYYATALAPESQAPIARRSSFPNTIGGASSVRRG